MSAIFPFAALRPTPDAAASVASVPYDVVNTEEARQLAQDKPLSFLRVSRAEIDLPPATDPYSDTVYEKAVSNFRELQQRAPLVTEDAPSFYVYRLHMGGHVQAGVAACFSIDEYERDIIKKHEKTRPDKEDDRTRHMMAIGAQTGPVFLTYKSSAAVDAVVDRTMRDAALFDFTAPDGVRHVVWRVPEGENDALMRAFAEIPYLYIADGHHRAASAARTRRALAGRGAGEHDRVLAVAFPDAQMKILPYNRLVKDLNGRSPVEFLRALDGRVTLASDAKPTPSGKGEVSMYLAGQWYSLRFPPSDDLDVSRLQDEVLEPVLGIRDVRTDKRIEFSGGIRGTLELQRLVDSGAFAVAFSMHPVSVDDLMRIADAGGIMPPKSTWFEPKLRDGLLSHLI